MSKEKEVESDPNYYKNKVENDISLTDRELIRQQISNISFEDLLKLKQKIGSKTYNKMLFEPNKSEVKVPMHFKRSNKNRPKEMSSKRNAHRKVNTPNVVNLTARDPRFDPLCGTFDDKSFKSNYTFLKDVRKKERKQLDVEYKNETDVKRQKKIKFLMQRMDNQIREQEKLEKRKRCAKEEKKNIRKCLMEGQKPIFKKKSEKRLEDLVNKYEELKNSNKLKKHIERKSKKLKSKQKMLMDNNFM